MPFDMLKARESYSDTQISDYLSSLHEGFDLGVARESYSDTQIVDYLNSEAFGIEEPEAPEVEEEAPKEYDIVGGVKDVGKLIYDIPVNTIGAVASFFEDDNPEAEYDWKDIARRAQDERAKQRAAEAGGESYVLPWLQRKDIREASASTGFSGVAMAAGVAGGAVAAPVPVPGARIVGGLAASGRAAYLMNKASFTQQLIDAYRQDMQQQEGRDPNPKEVDKFVRKTKNLRSKHSLWEAVPEAVGNVAQLTGIGAIFKAALGKKLGARIFQAVAGMYGVELATETITQTGQYNVEIEAGLTEGQRRKFTSFDDMHASFKEVAPSVFVLVSFTGGAGAVAGKTYQILANPKTTDEAAIINPIIKEVNAGRMSLDAAIEAINNSEVSDAVKQDATKLVRDIQNKEPTSDIDPESFEGRVQAEMAPVDTEMEAAAQERRLDKVEKEEAAEELRVDKEIIGAKKAPEKTPFFKTERAKKKAAEIKARRETQEYAPELPPGQQKEPYSPELAAKLKQKALPAPKGTLAEGAGVMVKAKPKVKVRKAEPEYQAVKEREPKIVLTGRKTGGNFKNEKSAQLAMKYRLKVDAERGIDTDKYDYAVVPARGKGFQIKRELKEVIDLSSFKREAEVAKPVDDSVLTHSNLFGDSSDANSLKSKSFNSVERDKQLVILSKVRASLNNAKILNSVVSLVPVDVMDKLIGEKGASEMLSHNPSMLSHSLAIPSDKPIRMSVIRFIDSLSSSVGSVTTSRRAKKSGLAFPAGPSAAESGVTSITSKDSQVTTSVVGDKEISTDASLLEAEKQAGNYPQGTISKLPALDTISNKLKIIIPTEIAETGETKQVKYNAVAELAEAKTDADQWQKLLDCLRA